MWQPSAGPSINDLLAQLASINQRIVKLRSELEVLNSQFVEHIRKQQQQGGGEP